MDHRCSARLPLRLTLDLFYRGEHLGRFTTRNIDSSGAFIEGDTPLLPANRLVELHFVSDNHQFEPLQRRGLVTRSDNGGVAVLFSDQPSGFLKMLDTVSANDDNTETDRELVADY